MSRGGSRSATCSWTPVVSRAKVLLVHDTGSLPTRSHEPLPRETYRARFDPGPDVPEPQRSAMIAAGIEAHMLRMRRAKRAVAAQRRLETALDEAAELDDEAS